MSWTRKGPPTLFKLPPPGIPPSRRRQRMVDILRIYAAQGKKLGDLVHPKITGRKLATLKRYCCENQIAFPDWVPLRMRPRKVKPRRLRKKVRGTEK